jgi:hypothetical protein
MREVAALDAYVFIHLVRILIDIWNMSPSTSFKNMNQSFLPCRKYEVKSGNFM